MYIFAANRNENNHMDSFTVCSDSDNNTGTVRHMKEAVCILNHKAIISSNHTVEVLHYTHVL